MGKGIHLLLKFLDSGIKVSNHFVFALQLTFFLFQDVYLSFLSLDFTFKIRNLFVLLLSDNFLFLGDGLDDFFLLFRDSFDDIFFMALKNIFNLREVGFDYLSHSAEVLKQRGNFLLQCCAEDARDLRLHRSDDHLDFFLVRGILSYEGALEFHNSFDNELELIDFGLLLIWKDHIIFKDLSDN
jgi:hypothetical protein